MGSRIYAGSVFRGAEWGLSVWLRLPYRPPPQCALTGQERGSLICLEQGADRGLPRVVPITLSKSVDCRVIVSRYLLNPSNDPIVKPYCSYVVFLFVNNGARSRFICGQDLRLASSDPAHIRYPLR